MDKSFTSILAVGLACFGAQGASAEILAQPSAVTGPGNPAPSIAAEGDTMSEPNAAAASASETDARSKWEFSITPYLWVAGIKGDIGIPRDQSVGVDKSFADVLGNLKFGMMLGMDLRKDRFVALGDIIYLSVGAEGEGTRDPQFLSGEADARVFASTAAIGYRAVDQGPLFVDVFAGARVLALDVDVKLTGPQMTVEREKSKSSIAPVVGSRFHAPLGRDFGIALYGDLGGFGATADMTWQLIGTIQYNISDHWRLAAGYRHFDINHDTSKFEFDVALSGPIIGVSYRF